MMDTPIPGYRALKQKTRLPDKSKLTRQFVFITNIPQTIELVISTSRAYTDVTELNTLTIIKNINR